MVTLNKYKSTTWMQVVNKIRKISVLLTRGEKRKALLLFVLVLVMAMLDVAGVASIMPFVAIVMDPQVVERNEFLLRIYEYFSFDDMRHFTIFFGLVTFALYSSSLVVKLLATYAQIKFVLMLEKSIGTRFVKGYLSKDYAWLISRSNVDMGKTVLSEVANFINSAMMPLVVIIAQSVVVIFLLTLMLAVQPIMALSVAAVFIPAFVVIYLLLSGRMAEMGRRRYEANSARFSVINRAFSAIKEVKIGGLEAKLIKSFAAAASSYASNLASGAAIAQLPRFALEALAFGGLLLVILYLMVDQENLTRMIPILAMYAVAGYRLMPALQLVYSSASQLKFSTEMIDLLVEEYVKLNLADSGLMRGKQINFTESIELRGVCYRSFATNEEILTGLNAVLEKGQIIGVVGRSGSGKSTFLDLFAGLLEPCEGTIFVDGDPIDGLSEKSWHDQVGYVPQHVTLFDDTIAANIAMYNDDQSIDMALVEQVSQVAQIHEFVTRELPAQYETKVGEGGMRLSGGQQQRIGIARALYRQPHVLILDEATSALDNITEADFLQELAKVAGEVTIVVAAHRLSTVKICSNILVFDKGSIVSQGSYDFLLRNCPTFKEIDNVSKEGM